jgi:hypothetical protein
MLLWVLAVLGSARICDADLPYTLTMSTLQANTNSSLGLSFTPPVNLLVGSQLELTLPHLTSSLVSRSVLVYKSPGIFWYAVTTTLPSGVLVQRTITDLMNPATGDYGSLLLRALDSNGQQMASGLPQLGWSFRDFLPNMVLSTRLAQQVVTLNISFIPATTLLNGSVQLLVTLGALSGTPQLNVSTNAVRMVPRGGVPQVVAIDVPELRSNQSYFVVLSNLVTPSANSSGSLVLTTTMNSQAVDHAAVAIAIVQCAAAQYFDETVPHDADICSNCSTSCAPGTVWTDDCSPFHDRTCTACVWGVSFSNVYSTGKALCSPCSTQCPPGSVWQTDCSAASDRICQPCANNTFSDVSTNSTATCTNCSLSCPAGTVWHAPCSARSDVSCTACVAGVNYQPTASGPECRLLRVHPATRLVRPTMCGAVRVHHIPTVYVAVAPLVHPNRV